MIEKNNKKLYFADIHIHSRFSRACSKDLNLQTLEKWARIKGLDLLGTGDLTHPEWLKELKENLIEKNGIFFTKNNFPFLLSGEISLMYSDELGDKEKCKNNKPTKGRKVHLVILAPNFEAIDKINAWLDTKGRRDYDGRPIFKITCEEFTAKMNIINEKIEVIPAHCLLPEELIHTNNGMKKIKDITKGELVLTHTGSFKKVKEILVHDYDNKLLKIVPWYFREGLETTLEHPYYAIKSFKNCSSIKGLCKPLCSSREVCRRKYYNNYTKQWIQAENLEVGDFLVYPRVKHEEDINEIDIRSYVKDIKETEEDFIICNNARNHAGKIKKQVKVDKRFCRLMGYFLSEGYLITDIGVGFSFHTKEKGYIGDVTSIIRDNFGFEVTRKDTRGENQCSLIFSSKLLNSFFKNFYFNEKNRANTKFLPREFAELSKEKLAEIFKGWWRGDTGNTVSRQLANQMKEICLKLGIIPSISIYSAENHKKYKHFIKEREIIARNDLIVFSNLSFFEEDYGMLSEDCFKKSINKLNRKHGWVDEDYVYLPIRKIVAREYSGKVYNLEVKKDNSYVSEFACVHNCWTPHFGVFGSASGYNSLKDAFKSQVNNIHAIETGISSDRNMNFGVDELKSKTILSFSDSHSYWPFRLGREATIFSSIKTYDEILNQIRENKIIGTIEVEPAYGKYHWDGHMDCGFSCSPEETKKLNGICPKCEKKLMIGVEYRVEELRNNYEKDKKIEFKILPLHEILSASIGKGMNTKQVWDIYNKLIEKFGNELNILLIVEKKDLLEIANEKTADLIIKNRNGEIKVKAGYDGVYGKLILENQNKLF